jgi:hypothetical protein
VVSPHAQQHGGDDTDRRAQLDRVEADQRPGRPRDHQDEHGGAAGHPALSEWGGEPEQDQRDRGRHGRGTPAGGDGPAARVGRGPRAGHGHGTGGEGERAPERLRDAGGDRHSGRGQQDGDDGDDQRARP